MICFLVDKNEQLQKRIAAEKNGSGEDLVSYIAIPGVKWAESTTTIIVSFVREKQNGEDGHPFVHRLT